MLAKFSSLSTFSSVVLVLASAVSLAEAAETPPAWAFPFLDPSVKLRPDDGTKHTLPGSTLSVTLTQIFDVFTAYDWYPEEHPPMPPAVAQGEKPEVRACGMCHMPNGQGRPENAALAGLPAEYIIRQTREIASGHRRSSVPNAGPQIRMRSSAAVSDEGLRQAADYFSKLTFKPWIRVVEADMAPKAVVAFGTMWAKAPEGGTEPLGRRIVEIPEDFERTEWRDPHAGFVAYVPVGSIAKGEALATTGGAKTPACTSCHGADLKGGEIAPPIAGRSATYLVRQLWDIQHGARVGAQTELMKPVVTGLDLDDMIALAAYAASRSP